MDDTALSVLVVDDDYRVASVHGAFVERVPGFRVVGTAHTAHDAQELAHSLHPDLVLMDVYLPDGDGIDVVRSLLSMPDPPAVMVISAASDVSTVRRAIQIGAVHYLVKPFSFNALADRLTGFRDAQSHITALPDDASQDDVNRIFELLRTSTATAQPPKTSHLAPTLQLVIDALTSSGASLSAADIAAIVGISRGTAQRYLSRLERTHEVKLELKYGQAGRPEHRYSINKR